MKVRDLLRDAVVEGMSEKKLNTLLTEELTDAGIEVVPFEPITNSRVVLDLCASVMGRIKSEAFGLVLVVRKATEWELFMQGGKEFPQAAYAVFFDSPALPFWRCWRRDSGSYYSFNDTEVLRVFAQALRDFQPEEETSEESA